MKNTGCRLFLLTLILVAFAASVNAQVYTSLVDGKTVNKNVYDLKTEVYLNGGPQNQNAAGLPLGTYYFQVTDPSGKDLLSTDDAVCRQAVVAANSAGKGVVFGVPAVTPPGCTTGLHTPGLVNALNGSKPVQLIPYLDTPNKGGEYKVSLISQDPNIGCGPSVVYPSTTDAKVLEFPSNCAKTDNFKVKERDSELPKLYTLSGKKFYDANNNNAYDAGEQLLEGWTIAVSGGYAETTTTDANGEYSFLVETGAAVTICEGLPAGWTQTYPLPGGAVSPFTAAAVDQQGVCWSGAVPPANLSGLDFGNNIKISGKKFYDANANAALDTGEGPVAGIKIMIANCGTDGSCAAGSQTNSQTVYTGNDGSWSAILRAPTQYYIVNEVLPPGGWVQSYPTTNNGVYVGMVGGTAPDQTKLCFGNFCLGPGGGKTLGFWSNKNGQALFGADDLAEMVALNLRNADGSHFNPASYASFRTWILSATATNMANMLSAQLAAM
jgi:hypothetical protein